SIKYDVLYLGKRYAPKELVGVAMELMTGKKFGPKSFKGGKDTECFKTLRRCGFTLIPKDTTDNESSLKEGQGRGLTYPERVAVELRAMEITRTALSENGFINIQDVSLRESYDFSAERDGLIWMVEVKGTTSISAEIFLLTAPELKLHQANK